jgi:hypothetical protein
MTKVVSCDDLFIVVRYDDFSGIRGDTDKIYLDRADAEKAAAELTANPRWNLTCSVITLAEYLDEVKSNARSEGYSDAHGVMRD